MTNKTTSTPLKKAVSAFLLASILSLPSISSARMPLNVNEPLTTVNVQDVKSESELPVIMRTGKYNNQPVNDLAISNFDIKPTGENDKFKLSFDMPAPSKLMYVRIVNEAGYDVYFQTLKNASGSFSQVVDLSSQPIGTYYFQVTVKGKVYVKKLTFS